jgi:hypothetical protein
MPIAAEYASPAKTTVPQGQPVKEPVKKVPPPAPPAVIIDSARGWRYRRVGFLGEVRSLVNSEADAQGGFARVYEVEDDAGHRRAIKVVHKAAIKTKKNKTKVRVLQAELTVAMGGNQAASSSRSPSCGAI